MCMCVIYPYQSFIIPSIHVEAQRELKSSRQQFYVFWLQSHA